MRKRRDKREHRVMKGLKRREERGGEREGKIWADSEGGQEGVD